MTWRGPGRSPHCSETGTGNDNLHFSGNPGGPFNEGVGLGYPNLNKLAGVFP